MEMDDIDIKMQTPGALQSMPSIPQPEDVVVTFGMFQKGLRPRHTNQNPYEAYFWGHRWMGVNMGVGQIPVMFALPGQCPHISDSEYCENL